MAFSDSELIGLAAGILTTLAFVPQVFRAYRTKSVEDLSLWMLIAFTAGVTLWVLYGVILHAVPIILANGVTLILALMLLGMKQIGRAHV